MNWNSYINVCFVVEFQTGLNLLTTNTSSDQSSVDDGISSNMEDKRAKNEVTLLIKNRGIGNFDRFKIML